MSDAASSNPFPLPLVPFERYMLADDRADYPMTGFLAMEFSGEFDRPAFEAALDEALTRHSLFRALVDRLPRKGLCWVAAPGLKPSLNWGDRGAPLECPRGEAIDPTAEVGLRIWVRQGDGRAEVTFQLHHACADAVGAFGFMGDLLAAYGIRTADGGPAPTLFPLEPASLWGRGEFENALPEPVPLPKTVQFATCETFKFFARRPTPLHAPPLIVGQEGQLQQFPGICTHTLDNSQTETLRAIAKGRGATLNDVLIRDMFSTIVAWNDRCAAGRRGRWLRINVPTNLRGEKDGRMPAANMMSYAFLSRRPADCHDSDALLDGIREETEIIKRWRLGQSLLSGIAVVEKIPGLLPLTLAGKRCFATVVLSNLGDPTWHFRGEFPRSNGLLRAGNVVLQRVTGAPPVRPMTRAALVLSKYAGQLTICVRCDPQVFRLADTRQFLALYVERLQQTAAVP